MNTYELIEFDQRGTPRTEAFEAPNDNEAICRAIDVSETPAMEVWRDGKMIKSLIWLVA